MKQIIVILLYISSITHVCGQINSRVINTAVPFLELPGSVSSLGMGNIGAGTLPDDNLFYNPAKIAFIKNTHLASLTYLPWARIISPDLNLLNVNYIINKDDNQAFGFNLTYYTMGNLTIKDNNGAELGTVASNEFALSGTYSKVLGYSTSIAASFRGIHSRLGAVSGVPGDPSVMIKPAFDVSADLSFYKMIELNYAQKIMMGANLSNLGPKMSYNAQSNKTFLPTNLRVGFGYNNEVNEDNAFTIGVDFNKLLVPTPPVYDVNGNILRGKNPNRTPIDALLSSFSDAPGRFSEEIQEISFAVGGEYRFKDQFLLRSGISYEDPSKGDRKYISFGAGFKGVLYDQKYEISISYLVPYSSSTTVSPFKNSFGLTLCYLLGELKTK